MSLMFLASKPHGQPVIICESGLTIEPDPISGRCIITFPTKERVSPGTLAVSQPFEMFVAALDRAGVLVRIEEPAPVPQISLEDMAQIADPNKPLPIIVRAGPQSHDPLAQKLHEMAAEAKDAPASKNRRRKEKT